MPRYAVLLFAGQQDPIHRVHITCKLAEVPDMLAGVVMDYLVGVPYPGTMRAHVVTGRRYTEYMVLLENDTMHVYRHVARYARAELCNGVGTRG